MANTLFLRLEGPLQSWGERAQWAERDTTTEPTKSGVVGLLGCALGVNSDRSLRELSQMLRMGVRCDKPGSELIDYHTVGGGYDQPTLLTAEGKPKVSSGRPHTEQTWRHYLSDASFLVALQGEPELIAKLTAAVRSPHWTIFLGRKSCPPSRPPFEGVGDFSDLEGALASRLPPPTTGKAEEIRMRLVIECEPAVNGAVRRRDQVETPSRRTFAPRYTCERLMTIRPASGSGESEA
jgi:CRISPR system Cascade subunit CasD